MKKYLLIAAGVISASSMFGQSAMEGFSLSQSDMRGTARFMSMAGAFGALGGDLSTLGQNPAGIGVYRNSDLGFTLNLDCQSATAKTPNFSTNDTQTKFYLNNIGYVGAFRVSNNAFLNFGFAYNKAASFNRRYQGYFGSLNSSLSNYIAGISNNAELTEGELSTDRFYDPYVGTSEFSAPWISILGYDSRLINPVYRNNDTSLIPDWKGQWGDGTSGTGYFAVEEKGSVDEYNISLGGSVNNIFFWGMDFGITDLNFTRYSMWGENLDNAYVARSNNSLDITQGPADWSLYNSYHASGTGFNYKLGFIVKPIQELRIGFAFHTPTWYSIDETFSGQVDYNYPNSEAGSGNALTNNGNYGYNSYNFRTPWKVIASVAGVIGERCIVSADYEWAGYGGMHYSDNSGDYDYSWYNPYDDVNNDVKAYYKGSNTLRIGAEYRITNNVSVRAGYSYVSSPVKAASKDGQETIYISGTRPAFSFDNETDYVTCGIGYRYKGFYADAAYVWKHQSLDYHAYPQDPESAVQSPVSDVTINHSQIVISLGFRF